MQLKLSDPQLKKLRSSGFTPKVLILFYAHVLLTHVSIAVTSRGIFQAGLTTSSYGWFRTKWIETGLKHNLIVKGVVCQDPITTQIEWRVSRREH